MNRTLAGLSCTYKPIGLRPAVSDTQTHTMKEEHLGTQTGLVFLARRDTDTELTQEDWFELAEMRYELIKESLRSMSLQAIGDVPGLALIDSSCLARGYRSINDERDQSKPPPTISVSEGLSLKTRGIFPLHYADTGHEQKGHGYGFHEEITPSPDCDEMGTPYRNRTTIKAWGLTRNGHWITIETQSVHKRHEGSGRPQQRNWLQREYSRVTEDILLEKVILRKSTLRDACAFAMQTPEYVCKRISDVAEQWLKHREELLRDARDVWETLEQEDLLMGSLYPNRKKQHSLPVSI